MNKTAPILDQKTGSDPRKRHTDPKLAPTRWPDGSGGFYVKVPNHQTNRDLVGKYRRDYGEPMATYFAKGGGVLAWQWRVRS